ncbi:hypothetical protein Q5P01_002246 [Channa striata]|uniref:Ig-like domain-containing protein n=1 Tax=Channa striata TaxID=64152 RepID=A0AA88T5Z8_CHASR|nr:hypothetical protein Q5P01_002246 [Channa striata]
MASAKIVSYLTILFLWKIVRMTSLKSPSSVDAESGFVSVNAGEKLTLHCFYNINMTARLFWYRQILGQKPRLISTFFVHHTSGTFYNEFKNNQRFILETGNSKNHLVILDLHISDSATYYCTRSEPYKFEFLETTTVSVKDSGLNIPALVLQAVSETIQPGGSVTLTCTVQTGTCDGEHSVYWFKDSEETHPGIIYTHGSRNDQCERKPDTQAHICVYNLPMKNLNHSRTESYYCAVVACGHILFGNRTQLGFKDDGVLFYFLCGALAFTTILVVLLAYLVHKMYKRNNCQSPEPQARLSGSCTTNTESQEADSLHYAALKFNLSNRSRRLQDNMQTECVYSGVKQ